MAMRRRKRFMAPRAGGRKFVGCTLVVWVLVAVFALLALNADAAEAQRTVVLQLDYADARVLVMLFGGWAPPPPARVPMRIPEYRHPRWRPGTAYLDLGDERQRPVRAKREIHWRQAP